MHVALARKYRPRAFGELIAQEHVAKGLRGAIEQNRVAHGYLLCGPRGVGKTTAARILAMALNCETRHAGRPTAAPGEPCGACPSCQRIWSGSASLDVVEIDAASNRGVDDARDLRERAMYAASQEGRHKVYIVDEAHMLTREAWNTLLKVLEEPPPGVVFVFATTEPGKISSTAAPVMSRLQRFDFRRVGPHDIAARIGEVAAAESLEVDPDAVELIARVANGGMRDALSVLDQVTAFGAGRVSDARVREVLGLVSDETFAELLDIVAARRAAAVFGYVARLVDGGVDLVAFAEGAGDLWRAALAASLGARPEGVSAALAERVRGAARDLAPGDLIRILRALEESEESIRRGGNPRVVLETLLARWALMDRTVEIAELLRGEPQQQRSRPEGRARRQAGPEGSAGPAAPGPAVSEPRVPPAGPPPAAEGPLTLDAVRAAWPRVLDALREDRKPLVAQALTEVEVAGFAEGLLRLRPLGSNPLVPETIAGKRAAIEAAAERVLGVRISVASHEEAHEDVPQPSSGSDAAPAGRPRRVTVSGARAERTRALRGKDPALDEAMDALDLELLE